MDEKRREDLRHIFDDLDVSKKLICYNLIDEMLFLEEQISELKKYPFIRFHPQNPALQKQTVAGKQYHEYMGEYTNIVRILISLSKKGDDEVDSPLREFFKHMDGLEVR